SRRWCSPGSAPQPPGGTSSPASGSTRRRRSGSASCTRSPPTSTRLSSASSPTSSPAGRLPFARRSGSFSSRGTRTISSRAPPLCGPATRARRVSAPSSRSAPRAGSADAANPKAAAAPVRGQVAHTFAAGDQPPARALLDDQRAPGRELSLDAVQDERERALVDEDQHVALGVHRLLGRPLPRAPLEQGRVQLLALQPPH